MKTGDEILVVRIMEPCEIDRPFKAVIDRYVDSMSAWAVVAGDNFVKLGLLGKRYYTRGERCLVKERDMRPLPADYEFRLKF